MSDAIQAASRDPQDPTQGPTQGTTQGPTRDVGPDTQEDQEDQEDPGDWENRPGHVDRAGQAEDEGPAGQSAARDPETNQHRRARTRAEPGWDPIAHPSEPHTKPARTGYAEVAEHLRQQITSGRLPPSTPLPSQNEIRNTYGVSVDTARAAIAALRRQGLITVIRGRGSFVRRTGRPNHTDTRTITRTVTRTGTDAGNSAAGEDTTRGQGTGAHTDYTVYTDADADRWRPADQQQPSMYHVNATADLALSVGVAEHTPLIGIDRLMEDPAGRRLRHTLYLPAATLADVPALENDPFLPMSRLYTELAAQHQLVSTEYVTARMPSPDDTKTLHIPDGTPLITTRRITRDAGTRQVLATEETRRSADDTQLAYTISP